MKEVEYFVFFGLIAFMLLVIAIYRPFRYKEAPVITEASKCESPIERRLYNALTYRDLHPRTQYPCGKYRIDIAFPYDWIAIECDGKEYHSTPEQKRRDRRKDAYLRQNGWKVRRFTGSQINRNPAKIAEKIEREINK